MPPLASGGGGGGGIRLNQVFYQKYTPNQMMHLEKENPIYNDHSFLNIWKKPKFWMENLRSYVLCHLKGTFSRKSFWDYSFKS
jgi:hypothetical protein